MNHVPELTIYKSVIVIADYYRIFQVLKNLISNSIKYSEENSNITISCEKRKKVINLKVIDQGKGIPKNHRRRIFERFYRVEKTRNRDEGGSGLGLSIVKHIIDAHDEKISVKELEEIFEKIGTKRQKFLMDLQVLPQQILFVLVFPQAAYHNLHTGQNRLLLREHLDNMDMVHLLKLRRLKAS